MIKAARKDNKVMNILHAYISSDIIMHNEIDLDVKS